MSSFRVKKAKYSLRADVFRFGPNNGHRSIGSACPFGAKSGHSTMVSARKPKRFQNVQPDGLGSFEIHNEFFRQADRRACAIKGARQHHRHPE
jgi:hypothetical protein